MGKFDGKVVLITGASRGIGRVAARKFAEEGAKVVVTSSSEGARSCADEISLAGGEAVFIKANLGIMEDVDMLFAKAVEAFGAPDILVNNAAVDDPMAVRGVQDLPLDLYDRIMDVNVKAPYRLCQLAIPRMEEKGGGAIVNVGSIASTGAGRGPLIYTVSKHALLGLTRELEFYHGRNGVRVNAVLPGGVYTELTKADFDNPEHPLAQAIAMSPAGRPATPEELANVILFLASDEAWFIQGSAIVADGGGTLC